MVAVCHVGLHDGARLADGSMWTTAYALTAATAADERKLSR